LGRGRTRRTLRRKERSLHLNTGGEATIALVPLALQNFFCEAVVLNFALDVFDVVSHVHQV